LSGFGCLLIKYFNLPLMTLMRWLFSGADWRFWSWQEQPVISIYSQRVQPRE